MNKEQQKLPTLESRFGQNQSIVRVILTAGSRNALTSQQVDELIQLVRHYEVPKEIVAYIYNLVKQREGAS